MRTLFFWCLCIISVRIYYIFLMHGKMILLFSDVVEEKFWKLLVWTQSILKQKSILKCIQMNVDRLLYLYC